MTWQRRLLELACAGGAAAIAACTGPHIPCGNANPDPCICGRENDNTPQCNAERECRDNGGTWEFSAGAPDPGMIGGECVGWPLDAGPDAPRDASDAGTDAPSVLSDATLLDAP